MGYFAGPATVRQTGADADNIRLLADKALDYKSVFDYMTLAERAAVRARGASVNVYDAIARALTRTDEGLEFPGGVYYYNDGSNLPTPTCAAIRGAGPTASILRPGANITKGLVLDSYGPRLIENFQLDGGFTDGATGLVLGDGSIYGAAEVRNIQIRQFGIYGVHVADVVNTVISNMFLSLNGIGVNLDGTMGTPTTTTFLGLRNDTSATKGIRIVSGYSILFLASTIQSAGEEAVFITGTKDAIQIMFGQHCWFENNCRFMSLPATRFQVKSVNTVQTTQLILDHCYFSGDAASPKSIDIDGGGNAGFELNKVQVPQSQPNGIRIRNGAYGSIDPPSNLDYSTLVEDPLGYVSNLRKEFEAFKASLLNPWSAWVPVLSSDQGDAATSFSAVTVQMARYRLIGKTLTVEVTFGGTFNALVTPATAVNITLPPGLSAFSTALYSSCTVASGANAASPGTVRAADGFLIFYRQDFVPYTVNTTFGGYVWAEFEIA